MPKHKIKGAPLIKKNNNICKYCGKKMGKTYVDCQFISAAKRAAGYKTVAMFFCTNCVVYYTDKEFDTGDKRISIINLPETARELQADEGIVITQADNLAKYWKSQGDIQDQKHREYIENYKKNKEEEEKRREQARLELERYEKEKIKEQQRAIADSFSYLYTTYNLQKDIFAQFQLVESDAIFELLSNKYTIGSKNIFDAINDAKVHEQVRKKLDDIYYSQKVDEIKSFFSANYKDENGREFVLDDEQARAIVDEHKSVLVAARAGSGKTRVIASKILYLIDHEKYKEDAILSLSFNTAVKEEVSERINSSIRRNGQEKPRHIEVARTFHSLANKCAPSHQILFGNERNQFIRRLIEYIKEFDPVFKEKVFLSFKKEDSQISGRHFSSPDNYYKYIRNRTFITLNGEHVRSLGEKWIADYLFEHNIRYFYEYRFYPSYIKDSVLKENCDKQKIKEFLDMNSRETEDGRQVRNFTAPDFYLPDYHCVWEHWGIDENETDKAVQAEFGKCFNQSWQEYKNHMDWKRNFWDKDWGKILFRKGKYIEDICSIKKLIETTVVDSNCSREEFELVLEKILIQNKIAIQEPDYDALYDHVWQIQVTRFTSMVVSFIDKYEQHFPNLRIEEFIKVTKEQTQSARTEIFTDLGITVLNYYFKILPMRIKPLRLSEYNSYDCDFNQLLKNATDEINAGHCDNLVLPLRIILIDEYQDFSELFYQFIKSILKRNSQIQLFCVGDDWQAINRFMGADTKYFYSFNSHFSDTSSVAITTNYRSTKTIVNNSSKLMQEYGFLGEAAKAYSKDTPLPVFKNIKDQFVERRIDIRYQEQYKIDETYSFLSRGESENPIATCYMKYCIETIIKDLEKNPTCKTLILSRTGKFLDYYELSEVERGIKKCLRVTWHVPEEQIQNVALTTMHKSKGQEADNVIILEANQRKMPLVHPDNELYSVFGETEQDILDDEMRLFYVAITRAKQNLYIIYDGELSPFLRNYMHITGYVTTEEKKNLILNTVESY